MREPGILSNLFTKTFIFFRPEAWHGLTAGYYRPTIACYMSEINIKTLARYLNLSIATVSKALRDSHEVKPATKQKVWEMARQLNYQPNPFGAGLRVQKSKTIAVIFPELANHFFALAINGIEEVARLYGYHVLIYLTHESAEQEIAFTRSLLGGRVDGLLISLSQTSHSYEHITELNSKIPVVLFDRVSEQVPVSKVTTDDYGSSYKATQHLVQQGCRSILYLSALNRLAAGQKRKQGYTDALQAAGISLREELVINCDHDDTTTLIRQAITTLQPDAIFSSIEKLSTTCYHLLHELGLSIPGDIKIASFSNLDNAALLCPPLTTVVQPAFEIGKAAAEILFRLLQKKATVTEEKEIASELIVRESSLT